MTRCSTSSVGGRRRLNSSPGWKQATRWSGATSRSGGTSLYVVSSARGQRSANAQAVHGPSSDGTRPGISCSLPFWSRCPAAGSRRAGRACTGAAARAKSSSTGASSTLRPAYMTSTRSARSATTPRLCVISTIAVPSRSRMSRIRSRMPAWIVTSSAVVGSSATSNFGSHASAIAIITRCRIPPESWCGYSSTRRAGAGMRTRSSSSTARRFAARRVIERCCSSTSAIWRPTRNDGLSDVIGSWKTNATWRPRIRRICRGDAVSRSMPSKRALPVDLRRRRQQPHEAHQADALPAAGLADDAEHLALVERERQVVDRLDDAVVGLEADAEPVDLEQRHGLARRPRIEDVAQAVAEQVERQRAEEDREAGVEDELRRRLVVVLARRRA